MIDPEPPARDAIDWHERLGARFAERYETSPAFRERARLWADVIATHVRAGGHVLDAGCGPGVIACLAARHCARVTALDASANMLAAARDAASIAGAANIDLCHGLIGDPALFAERRFDAILCSSVLEYVDDLEGALDWLTMRLAPGGALLVSMPNGRSIYRRLERLAFRVTGRPRYYGYVRHVPQESGFSGMLRARGFLIEDRRYYAGRGLLRKLIPFASAESVENLFVVVARKKPSAWPATDRERLLAPRGQPSHDARCNMTHRFQKLLGIRSRR